MNKFLLIVLVLVGHFLMACQRSEGSQSSFQQILVTGDPLEFIEGAKMDPDSGIPSDLFSEDSEWQIGSVVFATEEQIKITTQAEAEAANAPADEDRVKEIKESVRIFKLDRSTSPIKFQSIEGASFTFGFQEKQGQLFLSSITAPDGSWHLNQTDFQLHHYSVKKDQKAFSVLVSVDESGLDPRKKVNKTLASFYFVKKQSTNMLTEMISKAYNLLVGPGIKVAWDQDKPVEILICESHGAAKHYAELSEQAIEEWTPQFTNRLDIGSKRQSEACPPFSDLNTVVIRHVRNWVTLVGRPMTKAVMAGAVSYFSNQILDGDIFVFESEWDEAIGKTMGDTIVYSNEKVIESYLWTIVHELGHLWGLDHVFDERRSIMSYESETQLFDYDIEAIQALYPKRTPRTSNAQ